jgi:anti-sigma regulatory factor (Ser/Thr protein kinase)
VSLAESPAGFRHEAVLYSGVDGFLDRIAPFVLQGISAGEPTLVMVGGRRLAALRERLGDAAGGLVEFQDMEVVGANPARIIPAWDDFARRKSREGAVRFRGVGEPIWAGRSAAELDECHWHEALINRAFAHRDGFWLICPYDVESLAPGVVGDACQTHPLVSGHGEASGRMGDVRDASDFAPARPLTSSLEAPTTRVSEVGFDRERLGELRALIAAESAGAGMSPARVDDFVIAVNEVATNSVMHGGGRGIARIWCEVDDVVCEIRDAGVITDPLVDRTRPDRDPLDARGLWTVNRLCDLVQLRSSPGDGSVVRLLMHLQTRREAA